MWDPERLKVLSNEFCNMVSAKCTQFYNQYNIGSCALLNMWHQMMFTDHIQRWMVKFSFWYEQNKNIKKNLTLKTTSSWNWSNIFQCFVETWLQLLYTLLSRDTSFTKIRNRELTPGGDQVICRPPKCEWIVSVSWSEGRRAQKLIFGMSSIFDQQEILCFWD